MNVGKPSVTNQTLLSSGEFMVEKSLLSAMIVEKLLAEVRTLSSIRELTLERSRMNAASVEKLLAGAHT